MSYLSQFRLFLLVLSLNVLGILKNSTSNHHISAQAQAQAQAQAHAQAQEVTLQNTLQNAGRRRSSSATTRRGSTSRRSSLANTHHHDAAGDENSPRLKWDEANLYLTEQEKTAKMKIDEPKTPYAPQYKPAEDDDEMEQLELAEAEESLIDAQDVKVDELDREKKVTNPRRGVSDDEIPDLELGESEEPIHANGGGGESDRIVRERRLSNDSNKGEKHVVVGEDDGDHLMTTEEAEAKHRNFEQARKKHYEMRNIKEILAYVRLIWLFDHG